MRRNLKLALCTISLLGGLVLLPPAARTADACGPSCCNCDGGWFACRFACDAQFGTPPYEEGSPEWQHCYDVCAQGAERCWSGCCPTAC